MSLNTIFDWIVVGGGFTGAALAYELSRHQLQVLLVERHTALQGATRFSYGGIAYWSGTTDMTRQLCAEGIALHRSLPDQLEADTQFRELDLLLTIPATEDPQRVAQTYAQFAIPPQLLTVQAACDLEPLLNRAAISGALTVKHGHISPEAMNQAYLTAFLRQGGQIQTGTVTHLARPSTQHAVAVCCGVDCYQAAHVVVCAGALSRSLLRASGLPLPLYFTHAELVELAPTALSLQAMVMPADTKRFRLEAEASTTERDRLWDEPGFEPVPPILDAGAIQLQDGRIRLGQISRTLTDPGASLAAQESEAAIRQQVGALLPKVQDLPGTWHHCLVAFSRDQLPLIGAVAGASGVYVFSGFSNPLAIVPPLARRFAAQAVGATDPILAGLSPARFLP
ncbi:MAG: NAD(P)/FAD-dependent oxidoreductase [Leptolyngbyaceae cyanobacterium]